ncbi:Sulfotransferase [Trinorchestia longiramus]|nr:Sulfotransferase [Trinorchestia longiramus]
MPGRDSNPASDRRLVLTLLLLLTVLWLILVLVLTKHSSMSPRRFHLTKEFQQLSVPLSAKQNISVPSCSNNSFGSNKIHYPSKTIADPKFRNPGQIHAGEVEDVNQGMVVEAVTRKALDGSDLSFKEEQERRVAMVQRACASGASKTTYTTVKNFIVADIKESILFCPIYKSASSSWLITMLEMRGSWAPSYTAEDLNRVRNGIYKPVKNLPSQQETAFHTRFLVVRHPFERLLSCYRDKYEEANKAYYFKNYGKKMMLLYREVDSSYSEKEITNLLAKAEQDTERERTLGNPFANPFGPTFTEFVNYVVSRHTDDEHWRPYHAHCAPCTLHYNFILKFENLSTEGNDFLRHLYGTSKIGLPKENAYSGPPTADVICSYYSQLDAALLHKLVQKYQPDFDLFEYSPAAYLNCSDEYVKQ